MSRVYWIWLTCLLSMSSRVGEYNNTFVFHYKKLVLTIVRFLIIYKFFMLFVFNGSLAPYNNEFSQNLNTVKENI